jgi:acyl carrier protein
VTIAQQQFDPIIRKILVDVLALEPARVATFDYNTPLFGALPELDSMSVATLLTELEDRLGVTIDLADVELERLETFGGLLALAEAVSA